MITSKFRPLNLPKRWTIRDRLSGTTSTVHFQSRVRWYPANYKLNNETRARVFSRLHYLACHSPKKVAIQYVSVYNNYKKKNFASKPTRLEKYGEL